jgi:hypothetical protein
MNHLKACADHLQIHEGGSSPEHIVFFAHHVLS